MFKKVGKKERNSVIKVFFYIESISMKKFLLTATHGANV